MPRRNVAQTLSPHLRLLRRAARVACSPPEPISVLQTRVGIQLHHRRLHHRRDCLRLCGCRCRLARRCRAFLAAGGGGRERHETMSAGRQRMAHTPVDTYDFGNLRSSGGLSASLGSQVATSSSRYGRRCSGGGATVGSGTGCKAEVGDGCTSAVALAAALFAAFATRRAFSAASTQSR